MMLLLVVSGILVCVGLSVSTNPPLSSIDLSGCGVHKSCYRSPEDCVQNCDYILTWRLGDEQDVRFELQGSVADEEQYIALGMSLDVQMGADVVTDCIYAGDNRPFVVQLSYNVPYTETNALLNDPMSGLTWYSLTGYYGDGRIVCHFTRLINTTTGNFDVDDVISLDQEHHLFIAKGPVSEGKKGYHAGSKIVSSDKVNVASGQLVNIGGTTSFPLLVKVHGILMILAWMVCASFAILMPRYYKKAWPGRKCDNKDLWFQIHQYLMLATMCLTISGFAAIFIEVGGYAHYEDLPSKAHPPLGIATTVLVLLNPIMAVFRPHPAATKRPMFNVCHFCVGLAAHILSVATMYIGVSMTKAAMPDWSVKIMGAYVVWHVAVEITLAVHKHCCAKSAQDNSSYAMKHLGDKDPMAKAPEPEQANCLQTIVAVVHLAGVLALSITLIVPLASS